MPNEVISPESIEKLLTGEVITILTSLESTVGVPITVECYLLRTTDSEWVLVTALAGHVEIGFIDALHFPNSHRGRVATPHTASSVGWGNEHAHQAIRIQGAGNGFYVREEERGRAVGQTLFDTLEAVLLGLGVTHLDIDEPSPRARSFYERNGGVPELGRYSYKLHS